MEKKIRVFISYSSNIAKKVEGFTRVIRANGMEPLYMPEFRAGKGFDEQIKTFIQHAHIFVPVITHESTNWVHNEIGYAVAFNIPILPVIIGEANSTGMLGKIHAEKVNDLNEKNWKKILSSLEAIKDDKSTGAIFVLASEEDERAKMMARYAEDVLEIPESGLVRQKGGLSSFHIPGSPINKKVWEDRYYPVPKSHTHMKLQREERKALEKHAIQKGCRLIIDPSYAKAGNRSKLAARTRIKSLIEFLESMPDDKVVIAIMKEPQEFESLTIVGDWFLAESVSFKFFGGFTNTVFTRNAEEIFNRIEYFEAELEELLEENKWTEKNSRVKAIEALKILVSDYK